MLSWIRNLFRPKAEKVADAIQEDVLRACMDYGRAQLDDIELIVYHNALVERINRGGISLAVAVALSLEDAKSGRNVDEIRDETDASAVEG